MESQFNDKCPGCGSHLCATVMSCNSCGLRVEGQIQLPRLARLPAELREFAELFLLNGGSLKEMARQLGVSYPTVRSRLDRVMAVLGEMRGAEKVRRNEILDMLERGELTSKEAAEQLRRLPDNL